MQHSLDASYILDACVLIDFRDSELGVVSSFARSVKACYVGQSALDKVKRLTAAQAGKLNLKILTPDIEILEKSARLKGGLSPDDWETYFFAKKHGLICVSNDNRLRRKCEEAHVGVMWGLQTMKVLVHAGVQPVSQAIEVARKIGETNKRIKAETVALFERQVLDIARSL